MDAYIAPVSHAQRRLWFLDRLEPGNVVYNIPAAVRLRGELNIPRTEQALAGIIARHDALRTVFAMEEGSPVQVVQDFNGFALPILPLPPGAGLGEFLAAEAKRSFELTAGPLFRPLLVRVAEGDHVLLMSLHHIVADGWSMGVLVKEFIAHYNGSALPELPIQFADFVDWQNETLATADAEKQLNEYTLLLSGTPLALDVPADYPRPPQQSHRGDLLVRSLPADVTEKLERVARQENVTLFMFLLGVFEILLFRCSRQDRFLLGTPVAGRSHPDTEGLIGFFVNTLAVRADLEGNPTFRELLARVRQECLLAFGHEEVPFDRLVDAVQPERDRSRTPLFQTYFTLNNAPREALTLPSLEVSRIEVNLGVSRVDLTLGLEQTGAGLSGRWEFCSDVFSTSTIERWAGMFEVLCEAVCLDPSRRLSDLPLLTPEERTRLVEQASSTVSFPAETLPAWFARAAAQFSSRTSVSYGADTLSYLELDQRSNQVARQLNSLGAGPETRVGICLARSASLPVAILGVLKAGACYVPIDPAYPRERIEFMVRDSGLACIVKTGSIPFDAQVPLVDLEDPGIAAQSPEPLLCTADPDNAAYIIYTSGSTGQPKGCLVTHADVTRLMTATDPWFKFGPDDVWTLFHSFAFDFSVWEIWGALLYGGRLVVPSWEVSRSPEAFHELLETEGVTVLNQTPSAFRQLIAVDGMRSRSLKLRTVVFGGEALELSMLQPWVERRGDETPQLINMFGITETTVHVTWKRIQRADIEGGRGSLIGIPIPDLTVYVADGSIEPVPVGVPGEILVGGAGLARGYLGQPRLTAERFVPNPFGPGRLYRSGDLGRLLPDGGIEYLGRIDQQVKIRGFRIELGEIERVLSRLPGVREVAVLPRAEGTGEKRLIAYLAGGGDAERLSPTAARELCRGWLPDYMIPAAFVFLHSLPLTEHGKLDRRALPSPDSVQQTVAADFKPPQTETEMVLAGIWARVLGVPKVGLDDNFFALGGDSILTIQVVTQARQAGLRLSVKDLFERQTLGDLTGAAVAFSADESFSPGPGTNTYPLSPMQGGMLFQALLEPDRDVYFEQVSADIHGALNEEAFRSAWQGLMDRHSVLRTSFRWKDTEEPKQVVSEHVALDWTVLDWSAMASAAQTAAWQELLAADRRRGFVFDQAPLWRVNLIQLGKEHWRWLWSHFHALLDGWSLPLVFQDVLEDYDYLALGTGARPPEGFPYRRYVEWLRAQDPSRAEQYWRGRFDGVEPPSPLRFPKPKRQPASSDGAVELRLEGDLSSRLRDWTRQHNLTLSTVFQGAWALLLSRYAATSDVVFGVTVAGRPADLPGADKAIGLFINTLPLRVAVDSAAEIVGWLQRLQQNLIGAREFEYSALADVHRWSGIPSGAPLFESILVFENYPADELLRELPSSLRLENLQTAERTNYLLTAAVVPGREIGLRLHFDAFRAATESIEQMLRCWVQVVENFVGSGSARLGEIGFVLSKPGSELQSAGRATASLVNHRCIHELIGEQAARDPHAAALLGPGITVSYGEMMERAAELARELTQMGVGPESPVAVCMEKSPELVIGWLGVLMAGGAFMPLDPQFAGPRLAGLISDVQPAAIVLHARTERIASLAEAVPVLRLDRQLEHRAGQGADALPDVLPSNLAYIIHTSGSTGTPKGVMVSHAGLSNLALAQSGICGIGPGRRGLQFASVSFDAAVSEVFMALVSGAAIYLEPRDSAIDPKAFAALIHSERIDHATIPPALLRMLSPADFPGLSTLLVAGEAASDALYHEWAQGRDVFNAYGPTETTVCATMELVDRSADSVTLGRPLAGASVLVVDEMLNLLPHGVPGEIVVGGIGVARGYLNRPDLTARNFVPDPFSQVPGGRMYRTGDMGRWTADGRLEFLGRADRQVKVRGHRVEPAEVEAALAQHDSVADSVVLAETDDSLTYWLSAFVVTQADPQPTSAELLAHLRRVLPDYLVPRSVSVLLEWPLTSSGKIDRGALKAHSKTTADALPSSVEWLNDAEQEIAAIWSELLGVPGIGPDQNFFEMGGDSILSLQIVARAHRAGWIVSPRQIFGNPTVRGLAALAERQSNSNVGVNSVAEPDTNIPFPLTPIQHWFFDQRQEDPHHWNQSLMLELRDASLIPSIGPAFLKVVRHHSGFRLRFQREPDGAWKQFYAEHSEPDTLDLPQWPEAEMQQAMQSLQASLNLETGPLWRAAIFERGTGKKPLLFILIHHLMVDGVSWRILAEDLASACMGAPTLPAATASFADWERALEKSAATTERQAELPYWYSFANSAADLPTDFSPATAINDAITSDAVLLDLDPDTTEALLRQAGAAYRMNPNEILLAALARTLGTWTGRSEHVISLEGHGREELTPPIDITRTIGWFTTIFPCRLASRSFDADGDLLKKIKEDLRSIPEKGLGFGILRYLHPDHEVRARLASMPIPRLSFNYLGQTDQTLNPDAPFTLSPEPVAYGTSPRTRRVHWIDINAIVAEGSLRVTWIFSRNLHRRSTIEKLAHDFLQNLRYLVAHCLNPDAGAYTPSDFRLARLSSSELDAVLLDLEEASESTA